MYTCTYFPFSPKVLVFSLITDSFRRLQHTRRFLLPAIHQVSTVGRAQSTYWTNCILNEQCTCPLLYVLGTYYEPQLRFLLHSKPYCCTYCRMYCCTYCRMYCWQYCCIVWPYWFCTPYDQLIVNVQYCVRTDAFSISQQITNTDNDLFLLSLISSSFLVPLLFICIIFFFFSLLSFPVSSFFFLLSS